LWSLDHGAFEAMSASKALRETALKRVATQMGSKALTLLNCRNCNEWRDGRYQPKPLFALT
jgi:hypothetical protein